MVSENLVLRGRYWSAFIRRLNQFCENQLYQKSALSKISFIEISFVRISFISISPIGCSIRQPKIYRNLPKMTRGKKPLRRFFLEPRRGEEPEGFLDDQPGRLVH